MLDISLLGTGGMLPLPNRYLTSMLARHNGRKLLIDCGEGTQVTMSELGWGYKTVDVICFTHYHGDHVTGLPGLLLTIGNSGRTKPLTIIGPPGLKKVVNGLLVIAHDLKFNIIYKELAYKNNNLQIEDFHISTTPVKHGVACFAYSIEIKRQPKFLVENAKKNNIPQKHWQSLQGGETVVDGDITYTPAMVQGEPRPGIKVGYCTDGRPSKEIVDLVEDADLFICEGLYGNMEEQEQAIKYNHMIYSEAAQMAKDANVDEMWLTHYSPANTNTKEGLSNATDIFPNTKLGKDRKVKELKFK